jgi:cytochrome c-type biogenesis protein CcmE
MPVFSTTTLRDFTARLLGEPVPTAIVTVWVLVGAVALAWCCPVRWRRRLRIVVSLLLIAGAAAFLFWQGQKRNVEYYKHVDEVLANTDVWRGKRLQVHGCITEILQNTLNPQRYLFRIESTGQRPTAGMWARYRGWVPDTFRVGKEVVANGSLAPDGNLDVSTDGVLTRCPSTYDSRGPEPDCRRTSGGE